MCAKIYCLLVSLILTVVPAVAQTQKGYVKTKGRLGNNGSVIPGTKIQGATIGVKGGNSVVSDANGGFTLKVPTNKFNLSTVKKQGYNLTDPDILSKQFTVSGNDFIIVMEQPTQQQEGKLAAERKIRRTLEKQLREREDEIESLKEENRLSHEEYLKALEDL